MADQGFEVRLFAGAEEVPLPSSPAIALWNAATWAAERRPLAPGRIAIAYAADPTEHEHAASILAAGADTFVAAELFPSLERVVQAHVRRQRLTSQLEERGRLARLEQRALCSEPVPGDEPAARPLSARPDGILVLDGGAVVRAADRGAVALLGGRVLNRPASALLPGLDLHLRVPSIRLAPREGLRCDLVSRTGEAARALSVSVLPVSGSATSAVRWILLLIDERVRSLGCDAVRAGPFGAPAPARPALLDAASDVYRFGRLPFSTSLLTSMLPELVAQLDSRAPLLALGPPGSGRARLLRTVHYQGRAPERLLEVGCRLSPRSLELELFGGPGDAGPGEPARVGALRAARGGSLLLRDLEALAPSSQARLLAYLERSAGDTGERPARVLATASPDLRARAASGAFRSELLERFTVLPALPALGEMAAEIPALADRLAREEGSEGLTARAAEQLARCAWPGNVEELLRVLAEARSRAAEGPIDVEHLSCAHASPPHGAGEAPSRNGAPSASPDVPDWVVTDDDPISFDAYERKAILRALHQCDGDRRAAARLLGLSKSTMYRKLRELSIDR